MKKEIVINFTQREIRIAILEDTELVEFLIESGVGRISRIADFRLCCKT